MLCCVDELVPIEAVFFLEAFWGNSHQLYKIPPVIDSWVLV